MPDLSFEMNPLATLSGLLFLGLGWALWKRGKLPQEPIFFFSDLKDLLRVPPNLREKWYRLPFWLKIASLLFLTLAWMDPHFYLLRPFADSGEGLPSHTPREGIAIYLVLDQSGSMAQKITVDSPEKGRISVAKIQFVREITRDFVKGLPNDLVGLIGFARAAQVLSPLTLDHQAILDQLKDFWTVKRQEEDGTSIGYAIFKTANLIASTRHFAEELKEKSPYAIKSSIMLIVTDGFQDPNPLDRGDAYRSIELMDAAKYAKEQGVRVYIINVEPKIASEEFGSERRVMQKVAEVTGGKFYLLNNLGELQTIYADINQLEKSTFPVTAKLSKQEQPLRYQRFSLYPYLIACGLICLFASLLLETTLFRRAP